MAIDPAALEARVASLEAEARQNRLPIEARVFDVEAQIKGLKPKQKDGWEKLQAVSGIITAIVAGAVGLYLTGVVNSGLERSKLESANVEKMRDLIVKFNASDISADDAEAIGLTLAAFGSFAVPPLIAALGTSTQARASSAESALLAVALSDADAVCGALGSVLANRTRRYTHLMHRRAITLIGKIQCGGSARRALSEYAAFIDGASTQAGRDHVAQALDASLPVGRAEIADLKAALCDTPQQRQSATCLKAAP